MRLSHLIGLLFCNVLWSLVYSSSKHLLLEGYRPLEVSFIRYLFACLPGLVCIVWGGRRSLLARWLRDIGPSDWRIVAVGTLTFFITPWSQMTGLSYSRAMDGALMIAMEPLVTILAACLVLREKLRLWHLVSIVLAFSGALILSDVSVASFSGSAEPASNTRLLGNAIFLISMLSEAAYTVLAKPVLDRRPPLLFITLALCWGITLLFAYNVATGGLERLAGLRLLAERGSWADFGEFFFQGVGCTLVGYVFWIWVLKEGAPIAVMSLTLYLQPLLGVAWGSLFLSERVTTSTLVGGTFILAAVWLGNNASKKFAARQPSAV